MFVRLLLGYWSMFLLMRILGQKIFLKPLYREHFLAEKMLEFTLLEMLEALGKLLIA